QVGAFPLSLAAGDAPGGGRDGDAGAFGEAGVDGAGGAGAGRIAQAGAGGGRGVRGGVKGDLGGVAVDEAGGDARGPPLGCGVPGQAGAPRMAEAFAGPVVLAGALEAGGSQAPHAGVPLSGFDAPGSGWDLLSHGSVQFVQ